MASKIVVEASSTSPGIVYNVHNCIHSAMQTFDRGHQRRVEANRVEERYLGRRESLYNRRDQMAKKNAFGQSGGNGSSKVIVEPLLDDVKLEVITAHEVWDDAGQKTR